MNTKTTAALAAIVCIGLASCSVNSRNADPSIVKDSDAMFTVSPFVENPGSASLVYLDFETLSWTAQEKPADDPIAAMVAGKPDDRRVIVNIDGESNLIDLQTNEHTTTKPTYRGSKNAWVTEVFGAKPDGSFVALSNDGFVNGASQYTLIRQESGKKKTWHLGGAVMAHGLCNNKFLGAFHPAKPDGTADFSGPRHVFLQHGNNKPVIVDRHTGGKGKNWFAHQTEMLCDKDGGFVVLIHVEKSGQASWAIQKWHEAEGWKPKTIPLKFSAGSPKLEERIGEETSRLVGNRLYWVNNNGRMWATDMSTGETSLTFAIPAEQKHGCTFELKPDHFFTLCAHDTDIKLNKYSYDSKEPRQSWEFKGVGKYVQSTKGYVSQLISLT